MPPRTVLLVAMSLVLGACGGVRDAIQTESARRTPPSFDARELVDVLPAGRIPAITRPRFESVAKAGEWLSDGDPVIALSIGGEARAYPLAIMLWHEIVDDVVGGEPVAVTYAPLANAAMVYDRTLGGVIATFAVSGKLFRSDLVMYDWETRSLWTQLDGRAVAGRSTGASLGTLPSQIVSMATFRVGFPAGVVLSRPDSGRAYGFNPYAGYEARTKPFGGFIAIAPDRRRPPMERVVGVRFAGEASAVPYPGIRRDRVALLRVGGVEMVALWEPGARSALDAAQVARGRDVGQTGVFRPVIGTRILGFVAVPGGGFRDRQTGSTWNVLGIATAGPLRGRRLEPFVHVDTFWFAWSAFFPGTNA